MSEGTWSTRRGSSRSVAAPSVSSDPLANLNNGLAALLIGVTILEPVLWVVMGFALIFTRFNAAKPNENIFHVRPQLNFSRPTAAWSVLDENACLQGSLACTSTVVTSDYQTMDVAAALFAAVFLQMVWPALRFLAWATGRATADARLFELTFRARLDPLAYDGVFDVLGQVVTETLILVVCAHVIGLRQVQYPLMLACLVLQRRVGSELFATLMGSLARTSLVFTKEKDDVPNSVQAIASKAMTAPLMVPNAVAQLVSRVLVVGGELPRVVPSMLGLMWLVLELMPIVVLWTSLLLAWDGAARAHPRSVTVSLWVWFAYHVLEAAMAVLRPLFSTREAEVQIQAAALRRAGFMVAVVVSAAMLRDGLWGFVAAPAGYTVAATTMIV